MTRSVGILAACGLLVAAAGAAGAAAPAGPDGASWWVSAGLGAGAISPDPALADYRWDTRPAAQFAAQALLGRGPVALGVRYSQWQTTQGTGLATVTEDPRVGLSQGELIGQVRLATVWGVGIWAGGQAGRVRLAWEPGQITFPTGGTGGDVTVAFTPVTETVLGWGLTLQRAVGRSLDLALAAERTGFELDTRHRRGDEIVAGQQAFDNWSLRLHLAWNFDLAGKGQ